MNFHISFIIICILYKLYIIINILLIFLCNIKHNIYYYKMNYIKTYNKSNFTLLL